MLKSRSRVSGKSRGIVPGMPHGSIQAYNRWMNDRRERVKKFEDCCLENGFRELAPHVFERSGNFPATVTLTTLVHGNEIGGIEVFIKLLEEIRSGKIKLRTNLRLILANVEAYYADKRFIESDMNRSFGIDDPKTKEEIRAKEIEKYLDDSDVLVDIHQTIGATKTPFFIFELDEASYNFARHLHSSLPIVTYAKKRDFKGKTSTGYLIGKNKIAVTIETGQKAVEDIQISLGLEIVRKALHTDFSRPLPSSPFANTFTFSQVISNPDRSLEMVKVYQNFDPVRNGELMAKNKTTEVFAETDGVVLFAKYGDYAKTSVELALVLRPVQDLKELSNS
jgi:succinylglutamate desuccinylase